MNALSKILAATALAGVALSASPASAAFIDFETTAAGTPTVTGAPVNADFAPLGINFTNALYFQCGGGCPDPAFGHFISGAGTSSPFTAVFSGVTDSFSFQNVSFSSGTASAFATDGSLLQSINFDAFPATFSFNVTGINSLRFSGSGFGVDNFRFGAVTSPVPEPATWSMMLIGFGAMGYSMRRRRRTVGATMKAA